MLFDVILFDHVHMLVLSNMLRFAQESLEKLVADEVTEHWLLHGFEERSFSLACGHPLENHNDHVNQP